jgi:ABC-type transport system substrate-binding protein
VPVDPARAAALRRDARWQVVDGPGSAVVMLGLRHDRGPLLERAARAAVAAAIDRRELVQVVNHGFADPTTGWAAPSLVDWPAGKPPTPAAGKAAAFAAPLRFVAAPRDEALARAIAAQLARAGVPCEVAVGELRSPDWDLRLERTHGVPYDPISTLAARFTPPAEGATAASPSGAPSDPELARLVQALVADPDEARRAEHYTRIQARLDELLPVVPLFAPRRIAVVRAGLPLPKLEHDLYTADYGWLLAAK